MIFSSMLTTRNVFQMIQVGFLICHTHEDKDKHFSYLSKQLKKTNMFVLANLMKTSQNHIFVNIFHILFRRFLIFNLSLEIILRSLQGWKKCIFLDALWKTMNDMYLNTKEYALNLEQLLRNNSVCMWNDNSLGPPLIFKRRNHPLSI